MHPDNSSNEELVGKDRKVLFLTPIELSVRNYALRSLFPQAWRSLCSQHDTPSLGLRLSLDIFETPVAVTPQQEISKTLNSSPIRESANRALVIVL